MSPEVYAAIAEEIREIQSLAELEALWQFGQAEAPEYLEFGGQFSEQRELLKDQPPVEQGGGTEEPMPRLQRASSARVAKVYRLLKVDVSWSTKPQVHAVMAILAAHVQVGQVIAEPDIVRAMEANVGILQTTQGGKRIWDYYKGQHPEGLAMHGNVEVI